ncbi:general substrate transporter [Gloeopeniophorella convolvens]|nr:general substrate transporter [Gloeopeniophorella convolvens]
MPARSTHFTGYGCLVCLWVLVVSFQYGYHISALNQIQAVLTCRNSAPFYYYGLPTCIPMSDTTFSLVTSVFTVGGFLGSSTSSIAMDRYGRKAASRLSGLLVAIGSGLMGVAPTTTLLLFGRFLTGCGAGVGLCAGPVYLAEISPSEIRGSVGVLTQFAIVTGIMITQLLGLSMATPTLWRLVLLFSSSISVIQLCMSHFIVESPAWLKQQGNLEELHGTQSRLFKRTGTYVPFSTLPLPSSSSRLGPSDSVEDPLLDETSDPVQSESEGEQQAVKSTPVSIHNLIQSPEFRRPLVIVSSAMVAQQLSGINAVLYYSNNILSRVLSDAGPYISLGITIVNTIMTFPPIFLIERVGRRVLLLISIGGALLSLVIVGHGLDSGMMTTSSISILTFVMSFAIGLGPIPFIIISEVSPPRAVSALSSVALSLNWMANFLVGLVFLPLRNMLSGGDPTKEGRVFFVFAGLLLLCSSILFRSYRQ